MTKLYDEAPDSAEPSLAVGAVTATVAAILAVLAAFGLSLTEAQHDAVLVLVAAAAPMVAAWFTRKRVYSPASVRKLLGR